MIKLWVFANGTKFWRSNMQWHRANGPAIVRDNGQMEWYWYDRPVTEYEHMMLVAQETAND